MPTDSRISDLPVPSSSPPDGDVRAKKKGFVAPRSIRGRIMAGVLLIIPLAVTAFVIRYVYTAAMWIGVHIVNWVSWVVIWVRKLPVAEAPQIKTGEATWYESLIAIVLTVVLLYLLGWLGTNVVGRRIIEFFEGLLVRIPLVDTIYVAIKRIIQALSGSGRADGAEQRPVLIDFPHENMRTLAFMTNIITDRDTGKKFATVFVPTTPNPTSGYMEIVPIERITYTDFTMEQALSMILSGGATAPTDVRLQKPGTAPTAGAGQTTRTPKPQPMAR